MADYDVFNGDADGICALTQLRRAEPRGATLITGVKRDISLVKRVPAATGDRVTVLDVSLDKNRDAVVRLLETGASVDYTDHHYAGEIPDHPALTTHINTAADVCTSLLVNGRLKNRYLSWALVGAFGDNLDDSARQLAPQAGLTGPQLVQLKRLGILINYNGYGAAVADLHFAPDELYRRVSEFDTPFVFMDEDHDTFQHLDDGYESDMARARAIKPEPASTEHAAVLMLPDASWARRASGVYSNELANNHPDRAHAVVTEQASGTYLISVRAPLNRKTGADELCRQFPGGGGRAAAAGVNDLPADQLGAFTEAFTRQFAL